MVVTLLLLLALAWQFYLGYSRGLVKQVYLVLSTILAFAFAQAKYQNLAATLTFWVPYTQAIEEQSLTFYPDVSIFDMDKVFYAGVSFLSLFLLAYLVLRLFSLFLHVFPLDKLDRPTLNVVSGLLSLLVCLVFWAVTAKLLATLPFNQVQRVLEANIFLKSLINLPLLSQLLHQLWVVKVL